MHKPLCRRLHQPRLEKSLNPWARAHSNPQGAAGLLAPPWARAETGPSSGHGAMTGPHSPRLLTGAAARQDKGHRASSSPQHHRPPAQQRLPHSPSLGQLHAGAGLGSCHPREVLEGGGSRGSPHLCRQLLTPGFALRQTAAGAACGGADTGVSTIPPARAFLLAPTLPRPQRLVLCKTNRARGLGESCRPRCHQTGAAMGMWRWPRSMASGQF